MKIMTDKIHSDPELTKTRRISFSGLSTAEVRIVADILSGLENVDAIMGADDSSVVVTYCIAEHKLQELESILSAQGYRLESNLLEQIRLGLIHFAEEIQQENLNTPLHTRDNRLNAIYANTHKRQLDESSPLPPEELRDHF